MAAVPPTPASTPQNCPSGAERLVKNPTSFMTGLRHLYERNQGFAFWNATRDLKLLLRYDVDDDDEDDVSPTMIKFELAILYEENRDKSRALVELLNLEIDGYFDDEDEEFVFVIDDFCIPKNYDPLQGPNEHVLDAMHKINRLYATKICSCSRYLAKDGDETCTFCLMTEDVKAEPDFECTICYQTTSRRHATLQPCCLQYLHKVCLDQWSNVSSIDGAVACPLCRVKKYIA